jgi:predicted metal-dependent RNase
MATGGRVLHHLKAMAPNPCNGIVFPGFQAADALRLRIQDELGWCVAVPEQGATVMV